MIKIHLCGDIMTGRSFNELFRNELNFNIWSNTLSLFNQSDFTLGNLETTITNSNNKWPNKAFNYKLNPEYKDILRLPKFNHLNIANNHILDYQAEGLEDTIKNLDKLNIKYTGAGMNQQDANKYIIHDIKGLKIGVISYTDHYNYWKATISTLGINYINIESDYQYVLNYMSKIKKECDILILSIHHGSNYVDIISKRTKKFFHDILNVGVDIIHGHSAHHVLPIEQISDKYIFYSIGDFIDDYAVTEKYRNDLSFIAELQIDNKKIVKLNIFPTKITIDNNNYLKPYVSLLDKNNKDYQFIMDKTKFIQKGSNKYNDFRKLIIYTNPSNYVNLNQIIMNKKIKEGMSDRNLKIDIKRSDSNKIDLYGYDKLLKYTTDKITPEEFVKIFREIDKTHQRKDEIKRKELNKYEDITNSDLLIN